MGIRAGGDPLTAVVPDLDQLAADPRNYLTEGPLLFGPRSFYGLAALFGLPGVVLLISWRMDPAEYERLALGVAMLLGGSVWLFYSLAAAGHSLFLGPDGVEIRYRDTTVFCPWDLFDVDGEPWSPQNDDPAVGMTMPVAPVAVSLAVWRRGMVELARGMNIRAPQAAFLSANELLLPGRYELRSEDLGKLLILLGTKLGGRVKASDLRAVDRPPVGPPQADREGYYTVSLTRFKLPPCCVACAGEPSATLVLTASSGISPWLSRRPGGWSPAGQPIALEVPVCAKCHALAQAEAQRLVTRWMIGLGLVGALSGLFAPEDARLLACVFAALAGAMVGLLIGSIAGRPTPLLLRDYNPGTGTLRVKFRNPEVEKRYRQWEERRQ